ncbi:hypothetical protein EG329_004740 [Mollisiaceae sp. DMI_Dod_QoI]|nr:hypothetical protein EG329_004740 [Helotiales sp. DMI_Dod_QoI]
MADELSSFHATHFSSSGIDHFTLHFLGPAEDQECIEEEDEDDGLGYYEDGTKRTLTDQQIAIFRHSEIQAILRERRHAAEANDSDQIEGTDPIIGPVQAEKRSNDPVLKPVFDEGELEDGELGDDTTGSPTTTSQSSSNKRPFSKKKAKQAERGKQRGYFKQNVKPDLRKRTWDMVDQGLGGLDYDMGVSTAAPTHAPQRRQISYDDD